MMELQAIALISKAVEWATVQQRHILTSGRTLRANEIDTARAVGVSQPEKIRIKEVSSIPAPQDSVLAQTALQAGFIWDNMAGLTLFYGIFIREDSYDRELLAHECRHVCQYEQRGTIRAFLQEYIPQVLASGYDDAPLEKEAREAARKYELTLIRH
jgi:hypothetical protein